MISTGLQKLDEFLSGGIPNGVIVDIFGSNGTGKTQLLLQLSINSIKQTGSVFRYIFISLTLEFDSHNFSDLQ